MANQLVPSLAPEERPLEESETFSEQFLQKVPSWAIAMMIHILGGVILVWVMGLAESVAEEEVFLVGPPRVERDLPKFDPPELPEEKIFDAEAVEDPVVMDADVADHNKTEDEEEFKDAKGDDTKFLSDKPFQGRATNDVMGAGGGGGGAYGGRLGGKENLVARGGGEKDTEDAVLWALRWLARHQNTDGSWSVQGYISQCNKKLPDGNTYEGGKCLQNPGQENFNAGVTGLSLLAFLGAGYTHMSTGKYATYDGISFGEVVKRAIKWMQDHQDPEGCIGSRDVERYMYNHTICALALSEAYGLTGASAFKDNAQRAVDFTVQAQNSGKAWRYQYRSGDNDSSVTGWAVMVLKSAEFAQLPFPRTSYDGARAWFDDVTEEGYYRVGYTHKATSKVYIPGVNEHFEHHEALTAIAVMSRIFMMDKNKSDPRLSGGVELLLRDPPKWQDNFIDFYYWYYASLALFQYDGPSGPKWKKWNEPMKDALVKNQNTKSAGCKNGSWEAIDRWSSEGGRVYGTAINALTLEVYYRYPVIGTR